MKKYAKFASLFIAAFVACGVARAKAAGQESVTIATGTRLNAELASSIDSKKAKVGDAVNARITEAVKVDASEVIPKGTKLVGHLVQASARSKGDSDSALAIQFDKAVLKNGQEIPLSVWIRAIAAEPRETYQPGPDPNPTAGTPAAGQSPMGGTMHTRPAVPSPDAGGPSNSTDTAVGAAAGLNAKGQLTPSSSGVFGLDGVHLAADASSATQGSLITGSGKSLHLDSGTRLLLVWQTEAPAAQNK